MKTGHVNKVPHVVAATLGLFSLLAALIAVGAQAGYWTALPLSLDRDARDIMLEWGAIGAGVFTALAVRLLIPGLSIFRALATLLGGYIAGFSLIILLITPVLPFNFGWDYTLRFRYLALLIIPLLLSFPLLYVGFKRQPIHGLLQDVAFRAESIAERPLLTSFFYVVSALLGLVTFSLVSTALGAFFMVLGFFWFVQTIYQMGRVVQQPGPGDAPAGM
jgi:hypothetical protein